MYKTTCEVLQKLYKKVICSLHGDANSAYDILTSFEFVFFFFFASSNERYLGNYPWALSCFAM